MCRQVADSRSRTLRWQQACCFEFTLCRKRTESYCLIQVLAAFCQWSLDEAAEFVLSEILINEPPLWLRAGMLDGGRFAHEVVPDEMLKRIDTLIEDHERRDAILLQAGYTGRCRAAI